MMKTLWVPSVLAVALLVGFGQGSVAAEAPEAETPETAAPEVEAPQAVGPEAFESSAPAKPAGKLDELVFARLSALGIQPVLCSDDVFVRRAYLDAIGMLPTAEEARKFIDDPDTNKRRELIEHLLQRDEFADYWAMKWGDVLRIKAEFPVNLWPNAAQAYHRWVRASIAENKPYDQFARDLLTSSGSNFRVGQVNFYRAIPNKNPEGIASTAALTFMGSRTDAWPEGRLSGVAVFFSQVGYKPTSEWKEEIVYWDRLGTGAMPDQSVPGRDVAVTSRSRPAGAEGEEDDESEAGEAEAPPAPAPRGPLKAVFPDGASMELPADRDPREVFADWLITPKNPWFTRAIVNRVWAWLLGRGIVHEPDDIRDDNPPSNPELLAYLEKELIQSGYDLKHLYRLILNSSTYQLSSRPWPDVAGAEAQFASYPLRRLDAEVLIDALNAITGTTDLYTSPIPEPYTFIPADMRAVAVADGSITSQFLTLFGRSARATGMAGERDNALLPSQWLHMLNSSHVQSKLATGPKLAEVFDSGGDLSEITEKLYLTILSRRPTPEELKTVAEYVPATGSARRNGLIDVTWALINSTEFLYRH
jgi:hypothetical protein